MLTETIAPQAQALLPELTHEIQLTRRVLERAPEASFGWQPHPKSMTLGDLVSHISSLLDGINNTLHTDEMDLVTRHAAFVSASSTETLLTQLDARGEAALNALTDTDDETFSGNWTLRRGEHVIFSQRRAQVVRHLISHMAHHRGQAMLYLRLLDVPVPAIYGPSADEAY